MTDVLIIEDNDEEARRIAGWLELLTGDYAVFNPASFRRGNTSNQIDNILPHIEEMIEVKNPRVIVFDILLDRQGTMDFTGGTLCPMCADCYPGVGRVLVSTFPEEFAPDWKFGGCRQHFAWRKPWTRAGKGSTPGTEALLLRKLVRDSNHANDCRVRRLTDPPQKPLFP